MKVDSELSKVEAREPFNSRRISVCHIVTADLWAGAEAQIATQLAKLSAERDLLLRVIALAQGRLGQALRNAGVEVNVVSSPHGRFTSCYREALRFLRNKRIDVLHSHKSKEHILALLLARTLSVPHLVRTQHGMPEPRTLKDRLVYGLARRTASSASRIISVSSDLSRHLERYTDPQKITIVPNAVDLQHVKSPLSREAAKRTLGIPERVPAIGTAARLEPVKRIDLFLAVAQHLSAQCVLHAVPAPVFVIAGDGSERRRLQQLITHTSLHDKVFFLGHRDDVYDVVRAMDLLLITSDHEGMPTLVLEAMALGTPVVSRRVGGVPEIIDDGVEGVLVNASDPPLIARACLPLLTNLELACRLTEAAHEKIIRNFSAEANALQVAEIYRSLAYQHSADARYANAA